MRFPVRVFGGFGARYPLSYAFSMMDSSFAFVVTGFPFKLHVQAASHSAGQTLPVNSGKQFVFVRRLNACTIFPVYKRSFHSGIRLLSGQPLAIPEIIFPYWQNGTPQSIHLAACCFLSVSDSSS